jgi:hypothetical protein
MNMGKVLGGGSSINVMAWMRGHRNDWDFFATEAGDPAWSVAFGLGVVSRENGARAAILGSGALLGESQFSVSARPRFFYG